MVSMANHRNSNCGERGIIQVQESNATSIGKDWSHLLDCALRLLNVPCLQCTVDKNSEMLVVEDSSQVQVALRSQTKL